jgi:MFS family permease
VPLWFERLSAASLTAALMSILFVKNHPEEVGQVADGDRQTVSEIVHDAASPRPRVYRTQDHWTLREAAHTPTFWLLTLAAVDESVPGTATIAHAVPHLRDLGHSAAAAGAALGLFSTSSIFGTLTVGLLCDRVEPRIVWAVCISLIGAGMLVATRAYADAAMYLFTGMLGVGSGAALTCWHATVGNYFGPSLFPSILCAQLPVSNTIAAASPFSVGIVYDVRGSYTPAFVSLAAFSGLTAILLCFTRPPTRRSQLLNSAHLASTNRGVGAPPRAIRRRQRHPHQPAGARSSRWE